ncbi:hypothetical protein BDAP_001428 [Binucleata daphniae]
MDTFFILQCKNDSVYKISTNKESNMYNTFDICNHLPKLDCMILISPLDFLIDGIVHKLMTEMAIQKIKHLYPSTCATFAFKTENIFYISVDYVVEEEIQIDQDKLTIEKEEQIKDKIMNKDKIKCSIEIVQKMKLNKTYSRILYGELTDVISNAFMLLNELEDKVCLASNIFVDCMDENLKKLFEEKVMMQVCEENYSQIKHMKFLKIPSYITNSDLFYDAIKNDPVSIAGLVGGKKKKKNSTLFMIF